MLKETVRIKADFPGGYLIINKEDFDPRRHVLFVEPGQNAPGESKQEAQVQPKRGRPAKAKE